MCDNLYLNKGDKFGLLTVEGLEHKSENLARFSDYIYRCICVCGKTVYRRKVLLTSGACTTCGAKTHMAQRAKENFSKINTMEECGRYIKIFFIKDPTKFTIIDKEDYDKVKNYCWHLRNGYSSNKSGKIFNLHRLINNTPDGVFTDHKNRNKLDNRKVNLRNCTTEQNRANIVKQCNNTSGFLGVSFDHRRNKYASHITVHKKRIFLGYFGSPEVVFYVYRNKSLEVWGEFSPFMNEYKSLEEILKEQYLEVL